MDYEITKIIVKLEERIEALKERVEALEKRLDKNSNNTNNSSTSNENWQLVVSPKGNHPEYRTYNFDTGISKNIPRSEISVGISTVDDVYITVNDSKRVNFINLADYTTDAKGHHWYSAKYVWEVFINW